MSASNNSRFARTLSSFMSQFDDISEIRPTSEVRQITPRPPVILVMRGFQSRTAATSSFLRPVSTEDLEMGLSDPCINIDTVLRNTKVAAKHSKLLAKIMEAWSEDISRIVLRMQKQSTKLHRAVSKRLRVIG